MSTILKLEGINYGYIDGGYKREILKNLGYSFNSGTFYTILGPSGSGKTTLLSIMAGLDKAESGKIWFDGQDVDELGLYKYRRNKIGVVFQSYNLIPYLTGKENILLAMTETDNKLPPTMKELALALLNMVGIVETKANRLVTHLSGGEQQRIAIARAIAKQRRSACSPMSRPATWIRRPSRKSSSIFQMLAEKFGKTIIVVTHSNEVSKLSDQRILLRDGVLHDIKWKEQN
jgi:putative ABC transport system ATP-binding protein